MMTPPLVHVGVPKRGFNLQNALYYPIVPCNCMSFESEIVRNMSDVFAQSHRPREDARLALLSSCNSGLSLGLLLI